MHPAPAAPAGVARHLRECPHCGLVQRMPRAVYGQTIRCGRCGAWMRNVRADPVRAALACALTSAVLYLVALTAPMMTLSVLGRTNTVALLSGPIVLGETDTALSAIGALVGFTTVLAPGLILASDLVLFTGLLRQPVPGYVRTLLRFRSRFRPWAMTEVYMLGIFVAYSKLIALAHVGIQPAIYALAAMMVLMIATDGAFDAETAWERSCDARLDSLPDCRSFEEPAGRHVFGCHDCGLVMEAPHGALTTALRCPRCGATVHRRKPDSLRRTVAWLSAALILYIPANLLPVLTLERLGRGGPSTILGGVQELYAAGELPLALLVFFASITVPCVKVLGLGAMVLATWLGSDKLLRDRTSLFRVIDFIGRWSMIDVFMVSILVAVVRFGFLATVHAGYGIVAFASVVVLTLFAAAAFDPRLMWDVAAARSASRAALAPRTGRGPAAPVTATEHRPA